MEFCSEKLGNIPFDRLISNEISISYRRYCDELLSSLEALKGKSVVIRCADPVLFSISALLSWSCGCATYLTNHHWPHACFDRLVDDISPSLVLEDGSIKETRLDSKEQLDESLYIPTGGTTGELRFARHTYQSILNSARLTIGFLGNIPYDSFCCLPLYHVSGFMQLIRALISNGNIFFSNTTEKDLHPRSFISLVPTQLSKLIRSSSTLSILKQYDCIFLGGAKTSSHLIEVSRAHELNLGLTYGMTETASMITLLRPEEFKNGSRSSGKPLPGVKLSFLNENDSSSRRIQITSKTLFSGYHYELPKEIATFVAEDLGHLDDKGELFVEGRVDALINSGGEKISPKEIQQILSEHQHVDDSLVFGVRDDYWGERVVAFIKTNSGPDLSEALRGWLKGHLPPYKIPKDIICLEQFPFDEKGKIDKLFLLNELN